MENEQKNDQQQEAGKIRKKFESALANLTLVIGGETLYKPNLLIPVEIQAAVIELAKDEKKKVIDLFKEKVIALIQKKREHDKHLAQLKKEFEKKEEESMKNFTKEANDLLSMLKNIKDIEKNYYDVLMSTGTGTSSLETPAKEVKDEDDIPAVE